jgi:iron(III) transport system ATP-binding protein
MKHAGRPSASLRLARAPEQRPKAAATIAGRLTFEAIHHAYDGIPTLRGVSLDIEAGEVVALLGHSGCGKTTLLRVAAGIERQSAGRVLINGAEMAGPGVFLPPEKRGVGLVFQDYALFPHMRILDNVMFGLTNLPRAEAEREALNALARVGLVAYAQDYPHALSGGEQQRVALARAIAPRPAVLLLDEPFSGLDKRLRDSVRDETTAVLKETRATCVMVTHDPEEAMRIADRIALMRGGEVVQVGTAADLYSNPADRFVARFFSELNEITAVAGDGRVETPLGVFAAPGISAGTPVHVGIRLQGVRLGPPHCGVAGRIVRRRFLGEVDLFEVAVQGLDQPILARLRDARGLNIGHDVGVTLDLMDVLVFADGTH